MNTLRSIAFLAVFIGLIGSPVKVYAATPPAFPSCVNPEGTLTSSHPTGTFGIAGKTGGFAGSDAVYKISDQALTQCFCPVDGNGIQTNWWKVSDLTPEEINEQIAKGWILVPDGSVWGLEAEPYLALNLDYSCSTGSVRGTSSKSSNNTGAGGQVLSAVTGQVLGLAATGNMDTIMLLATFGVLLMTSGFLIRRK